MIKFLQTEYITESQRKDGCRSTCLFFLEFLTNAEGKNYKLKNFVSQYNHPLRKNNTNIITTEIKEELTKLSGKFKTSQALRNHINDNFKTNIGYHQIYYAESTSTVNSSKKSLDDAMTLITLVQDEKNQNISNYALMLNSCDELENFLYISHEMRDLYCSFDDVLIIDSTLKKNRFNMPIVLFICIDNHGLSRIVGFGLISNESKLSYEWILRNL